MLVAIEAFIELLRSQPILQDLDLRLRHHESTHVVTQP
jgi:hypothetical protein